MERQALFDIWAPPGAPWSLWAKSVLFVQMPEPGAAAPPMADTAPWQDCETAWVPAGDGHTFLVIDLPAEESVYTALAVARRGYRPVPLYNACTADRELVDQKRIQRALRHGAADLQAQRLAADAPPAFLLDSLRSYYRGGLPGDFDNHWRVYPEDFPSVELLRSRGLTRMVLVQSGRPGVPDDLQMALWDLQQAGIELLCKDVTSPPAPQPLRLAAPSWLRRLWEWVLGGLGLRRGPATGFGHRIAEPSHG
jgi:hypothetical protein